MSGLVGGCGFKSEVVREHTEKDSSELHRAALGRFG